MKIQQHDLFHGAALTQIVKHESFKALNRASAKLGHYLINTNREVYTKYRTEDAGPWHHNLHPDQLAAIAESLRGPHRVFLCLVCGPVTICCLDEEEIAALIDTSSSSQQSVKVEVPPAGSCHVSGNLGSLSHTIPHTSFPNKVFT
jgi:hypothetical protein